jgi:hypothetical protein
VRIDEDGLESLGFTAEKGNGVISLTIVMAVEDSVRLSSSLSPQDHGLSLTVVCLF